MKPRYWQAGVFTLALGICTSAHTSDLPETSIYHLDVTMTDQQGTAVSLDAFRGHPVVISMFYATCPNVCPQTFMASMICMVLCGNGSKTTTRCWLQPTIA